MNPRRLTPSMSLLVAFEATARHLSFTRAGEELSLTQSAVSRQVRALEELLEVTLFRRDQRQIELTEVGALYAREVAGALQRVRNASLQVMAFRSGGGILHLAALPTFASKWLLPRLKEFYQKHPDIFIHMHVRIGQFDLERAGMDVAIGVGDGHWPGLQSYPLIEEWLLPVISPTLAASQPINEPIDLTRHLLLQVTARPFVWRQWFQAHGLPDAAMRLGPQFELTSHLIQAVVGGMGVGLVPSFLVEDELREGSLQLAIDSPLRSGLFYHLFVPPNLANLPHVLAFRNWLMTAREPQVHGRETGA
ncbi:LysR family transcriptional regulator [Cupriavidus sp. IDO]|nr:LysR substrate-binding domain-containing protein [Cupriavidus sp. IDO]KWR84607.1 LysR family transcriptional regulator [Cupriavidus sp. IDO]